MSQTNTLSCSDVRENLWRRIHRSVEGGVRQSDRKREQKQLDKHTKKSKHRTQETRAHTDRQTDEHLLSFRFNTDKTSFYKPEPNIPSLNIPENTHTQHLLTHTSTNPQTCTHMHTQNLSCAISDPSHTHSYFTHYHMY